MMDQRVRSIYMAMMRSYKFPYDDWFTVYKYTEEAGVTEYYTAEQHSKRILKGLIDDSGS